MISSSSARAGGVTRVCLTALLCALVGGIAGGAAKLSAGFPPGQAVPSVETVVDANQTYALYLPSSYAPQRPAPILYCFDPRSRGMFCLDLFRETAERFGYIIASSNNSRSDGPMEPNKEAMMSMWLDTHERFSIDDRRTYATGFSGGARVATIMGNLFNFAGVVAVGAGFSSSYPPSKDLSFGLFGLSGELDFNYYELRELDKTLDTLGVPHRIEAFDGGHEWAPPEKCGEALEWMELLAMQRGLREVDETLVGELWTGWFDEAATLERHGRAYDAWRKFTAMTREFDGLHDVSPAAAAAARLAGTKDYRRERKERRRWDAWSFGYKERLRAVIGRLRDAGAPPPGSTEIHSTLHLTAVMEKAADLSTEEGRAARRVLEDVYVLLAFYMVRDFLAADQYDRARVCLEIATEIKPERAGPWYNLACTQARLGAPAKALASLGRAIDNGFSDAELLRTDPDLASVRDSEEFARLLATLSP